MSRAMFKIEWLQGYGDIDGSSLTVAREWFSEENGFDDDDRDAIAALAEGQSHDMGGPLDRARVTRVADGTEATA